MYVICQNENEKDKYLCYDSNSGGYPYFGNLTNSKIFISLEDAILALARDKNYLDMSRAYISEIKFEKISHKDIEALNEKKLDDLVLELKEKYSESELKKLRGKL